MESKQTYPIFSTNDKTEIDLRNNFAEEKNLCTANIDGKFLVLSKHL
jgi:hypothetical protein